MSRKAAQDERAEVEALWPQPTRSARVTGILEAMIAVARELLEERDARDLVGNLLGTLLLDAEDGIDEVDAHAAASVARRGHPPELASKLAHSFRVSYAAHYVQERKA